MNGKIINDPVYGFIQFKEPELMQIINHPWFQRLRGIKQMGMAQFVYPGAVHTRFHHSLGATHLMGIALQQLQQKQVEISDRECIGARQAILMHDIGHGPFSHALEKTLIQNVSHEDISLQIMHTLNQEFDGQLDIALSIFQHQHPKHFLHQLVSSQLDTDRMDYLTRDSFFSGVTEGNIGYDRILQMLTVVDNELAIEEKGIFSVEKFIVARRLMYWQVYLHKTVLGSEKLIVRILKRAKELANKGIQLFASPALQFFLYNHIDRNDFLSHPSVLEEFCRLDDGDITIAIKVWSTHQDEILATLCKMFITRQLYKVKLTTESVNDDYERLKKQGYESGILNEENESYYVFTGIAKNNTYKSNDEKICISLKNGLIKDISDIDNALISRNVAVEIKKQYLCYIPRLKY